MLLILKILRNREKKTMKIMYIPKIQKFSIINS